MLLYRVIERFCGKYSVEAIYEVFEVSRSGYYACSASLINAHWERSTKGFNGIRCLYDKDNSGKSTRCHGYFRAAHRRRGTGLRWHGYLGADKRPEATKKNIHGKRIQYKINRRPSQSKDNSARSQSQIKRCERKKSSVRVKVEHVFAVAKLQLRFRKTRYRGLTKQVTKMNMIFALANLTLADRPLPGSFSQCAFTRKSRNTSDCFYGRAFFLASLA